MISFHLRYNVNEVKFDLIHQLLFVLQFVFTEDMPSTIPTTTETPNAGLYEHWLVVLLVVGIILLIVVLLVIGISAHLIQRYIKHS